MTQAETPRRGPMEGGPGVIDRLKDQMEWCEHKSQAAHRAYQSVRLLQLVLIAAIAVAVLFIADVELVIAIVAVPLLALEAIQLRFQWQANWVLYRSAADALEHETFLYEAQAGPYCSTQRDQILAARVEAIVSGEQIA